MTKTMFIYGKLTYRELELFGELSVYHNLFYHLQWHFNPLPAKLSNLNFQPFEVTSCCATHNFKWLKITHIRYI